MRLGIYTRLFTLEWNSSEYLSISADIHTDEPGHYAMLS